MYRGSEGGKEKAEFKRQRQKTDGGHRDSPERVSAGPPLGEHRLLPRTPEQAVAHEGTGQGASLDFMRQTLGPRSLAQPNIHVHLTFDPPNLGSSPPSVSAELRVQDLCR